MDCVGKRQSLWMTGDASGASILCRDFLGYIYTFLVWKPKLLEAEVLMSMLSNDILMLDLLGPNMISAPSMHCSRNYKLIGLEDRLCSCSEGYIFSHTDVNASTASRVVARQMDYHFKWPLFRKKQSPKSHLNVKHRLVINWFSRPVFCCWSFH